ncbi:hypothetical protein AA13595_0213 [Gluconacetobacter johannae DSM 13595]|nr:hypothetical protein AA13595_0213 [Gluconacetobacter johannae DSM 13595]
MTAWSPTEKLSFRKKAAGCRSNQSKSDQIGFTWLHLMGTILTYPRQPEKGRCMSGRWMSVEEMAGYLGVSKDTIYGWIAKREMPAHKVGRLWKFKSDEVDSWVRAGKASDEDNDQSVGDAQGSEKRTSERKR